MDYSRCRLTGLSPAVVLLGQHLPALPQGTAVMTGLSAAAQPHWARLITGSSPAGELWRAAWHRSTRFSSRLPLGLCWQWVSLEFTLLVNKYPPLTKPMGIDGSLEALVSYCGLHLLYVMCSGQYCAAWVCLHMLMYAAFSCSSHWDDLHLVCWAATCWGGFELTAISNQSLAH